MPAIMVSWRSRGRPFLCRSHTYEVQSHFLTARGRERLTIPDAPAPKVRWRLQREISMGARHEYFGSQTTYKSQVSVIEQALETAALMYPS